MLQKRIFLIIAEEYITRRGLFESILKYQIKERFSSLNKLTFYPTDITLSLLKSNLLSFSFGGDKVAIFKQADKLPQDIKGFLKDNLNKLTEMNYLIFEIERNYEELLKDRKFAGDMFFQELLCNAYISKTSVRKEDASLKTVRWAVRRKDLRRAIYLVERLFQENPQNSKVLGLQILGTLVKEAQLLPPSEREKYYKLLLQSDRMIKEGKSNEKVAVEVFITKLLAE